MTELPPPLTPPDCDLNSFAYMPLDCARLKRSKTWLICKRRPDLAFYMVNLWMAAWHEIPCASLEDDDDVLADKACCDPTRWTDVKADVMRGWIKCSDGRLYHPVVAEKALESWFKKQQYNWEKEVDRLRKANKKRVSEGLPPLPIPSEPTQQGALFPSEASGQSKDFQRNDGGNPAETALKVSKGNVRKRKETLNPLVGQKQPDLAGNDSSPSKEVGAPQKPAAPNPVDVIFAYWQKVMESPRSVLDKNRRGLIERALKSHSPADVCRAIRGCSRTPHNMGENDRKTKYNGLSLILRNAEKIDQFIRNDETAPRAGTGESIESQNARILAELNGQGDGNVIEMRP